MDTSPVVEQLAAIPIGTIIIWVVVIGGIISAIIAGTVKLYKTFEKYKGLKDEQESRIKTLKQHDKTLEDIQNSLKRIEEIYEIEHKTHKKMLKHSITSYCNDALRDGDIKLSTLKSIEEMYEDYVNVFDGNSWVHTLVDKVRLLPIEQDIDDGDAGSLS